MADDLLNSMLGGSDDDDKGNALNDLLGQATSAPGAAKGAGADALGGLAGMLGGAGGGDLGGIWTWVVAPAPRCPVSRTRGKSSSPIVPKRCCDSR